MKTPYSHNEAAKPFIATPSAWLVLCARLFLVYLFLFIFGWIVFYVDSTLLLGKSTPFVKVFRWVAFKALVQFLFIVFPLIYVMNRRNHLFSYFLGAALGFAIWNIVEVGMLGLSRGTLIRHGLMFYDKGVITLWGLSASALSLLVMSVLVAVSLKISGKWFGVRRGASAIG